MSARDPSTHDPDTLRWTRRALLGLVIAGTVVLLVDLALLEHVESALQWAPIVALGLGLVAEIAVLVRPTRPTLRAFRGVMGLFVALGVLGIYLHYRGNLLFELEMDPDRGGLGLLWTAARGGVPTLAPAGLAGLGLVGWVHAFRHPGLDGSPNP